MKNISLFSADERKWSIIALLLFVFSLMAGWGYYVNGSIGTDLVDIISTGFYSLTGINLGNAGKSAYQTYVSSVMSPSNPNSVNINDYTTSSEANKTNYV